MMLNEYLIQSKVKPVTKLDAYCKLEGLDPMYFRSVAAKGLREPKKNGWTKGRLFRKWIEHIVYSNS